MLRVTKSPTSPLNNWLVSLCKPLMSTQMSYIKNSSELVKKLKEVEISSNSIISSFDIVSMYTSIDVKAGEILLERKILRNLDLISGKIVLEVGVIMSLFTLCNMVSYFFFNSEGGGGFRTSKWFTYGGPFKSFIGKLFCRKY